MKLFSTKKPVALVVTALAFAFVTLPASAYVGPGAGISALGSLFSLLAAIGLAIVGFIWYPIKRLLRAMRPADPPRPETPDEAG